MKVALHELESMRREKKMMLHDLRNITGHGVICDPKRGLMYSWRDGWIRSFDLSVEREARLLPHTDC